LVFVAMPLKYWAGLPLAVRIVGMAHGVGVKRGWSKTRWGLAFLSSLVPFGTFVLDRSLKREIAGAA
jgi:integral membrane protein